MGGTVTVQFDIDDSNYKLIVEQAKKAGYGTGWAGSSGKPVSGFGGNPKRWDPAWTMTRSEIVAEAKRLQESGYDVRKEVESRGWQILMQDQTNFCWTHGPVGMAEISSILENGFYVPLSADSVACRLNGFRNQGGWGSQAVQFMADAEGGIVPRIIWPNGNAGFSRKWLTDEALAAAKIFRVEEYFELPQNSFEVLATCVLRLRRAVAIGLDWWGHEVVVCGIEVDSRGNLWGVGPNSWGAGWGDRGWFRLAMGRLVASDQVCIRQMNQISEADFKRFKGRNAASVALAT
jgi:hypothetical protein